MTLVLEAALAEIARLSPQEQDALGTLLLDEMKSEQRWTDSFGKSQDLLKGLAEEAISEFSAGKSKPLDQSL